MFRYLGLFLVPAVMFLVSPAPVAAQWGPRIPGAGRSPSMAEGITGPYVNQETGGTCFVYPVAGGYLFVDDAAQRVPFVPIGNGRLESVPTNRMRLPTITVTVGRDGLGRFVLRFDALGVAPGYWVSAS
jgi:hypothetical protein